MTNSLSLKKVIRLTIVMSMALAVFALTASHADAAPIDQKTCLSAQSQSPYPGWTVVVDEQEVSTLYPIGFAPANELSCLAQSGPGSSAQTGQGSTYAVMQSPYRGLVIVFDEQGVPTLYPAMQVAE